MHHDQQDDQDGHVGRARGAAQARARPAHARARARAAARRRTVLGAGHIAIRPPPKTIRPPIQIHITSGETMKWNCAGGGLLQVGARQVADRDERLFGGERRVADLDDPLQRRGFDVGGDRAPDVARDAARPC